MKITIDNQIFAKFSDVNIGLVFAKNIHNNGKYAEVKGLIREKEKEIKDNFNSMELSKNPKINAWRKTYSAFGAKPKNIILFVADGMGFSHLSLAMHTLQSENVPSVWHEFDVKGWHDTKSTYGPLTDSGASATAMATGTATFMSLTKLYIHASMYVR